MRRSELAHLAAPVRPAPAATRRLAALLAAHAGLIVWLKYGFSFEPDWLRTLYLPLHTAMEVVAVVVAAMICSTGWHSLNGRGARAALLSAAFGAVALLDLGHLMSVQGMPAFVTPASVSKGIAFWLAGRAVCALALLALALLPAAPEPAGRARWPLPAAAAAGLVALVYWAVLYRHAALPATFVAGAGLTGFKLGSEYLLSALYLLAAALLLRRALRQPARHANCLVAAAAIMAMSEICFTLYQRVDDVFNLLGHVYKVLAYGYLYRAIFVAAVREPYQLLRQSEQSLAESEAKFRRLMECAPDAILLVEAGGAIGMMNARAEAMFGLGRGAARALAVEALLPFWRAAPEGAEVLCRRADGSPFPAEVGRGALGGADGAQEVVIVRDISERRRAAQENERLLAILEATPDVVSVLDTERRTLYLNRAGRALAGLAGDANPAALARADGCLSDASRRLLREQGAPAARRDGSWTGEALLRRHDGVEVPVSLALLCHKDADGAPAYWSTVCRDLSERKQFEQALLDQLRHDALTGLPNRLRILDQLRAALAHARARGSLLAVQLLHIDFFQKVNDSFGHAEGDAVLRECVARFARALAPGDTLARQGGAEFIILQNDIGQPEQAAALAGQLLGALRAPFLIHGHEVFLGASLGIGLLSDDCAGAERLLHQAQLAMNRAKQDGRNCHRFHTAEMDHAIRARLELESYLRYAVEKNELLLHYQPRVSVAGGAMLGVEALVRWQHPVLGLVPPARFIPLAEESGLIEEIGLWVLRQACAQARAWQREGLPPLCVSVNLSARQFQQAGLAQRIQSVLDQTGLDASCLELELTESTVMHDTAAAVTALSALKRLGVALSIDDFGTGYSSLSYLKLFPLDVLKIDRSFVKDVISDPDDAAITRAIVALAHGLDLEVVAEGVETLEQARFLRSVGCDQMQGYYLSRPVPPEQLAVLLREARMPALAPNWAAPA